MAIDKEPLRSISFPDWSQLKSDGRAVELQKRCDSSRSVAMFRISESEFLFVFEGMLQRANYRTNEKRILMLACLQISPSTLTSMVTLFHGGMKM